jgi:hypothetical protein
MDMSEQAEDRKACFEIGNEPGIRPVQAGRRTLFQPRPSAAGPARLLNKALQEGKT